jgi:Lrp/AsnC family transcriptional regulator, leucine-responsive regulatory protein
MGINYPMQRLTDEPIEKLPKVDIKDKKILTLLSENSRMPISEIDKKVTLSRDSISYRIKGMKEGGIIQGLYPSINFKKLGYNIYHLFLLVDESSREKQKQLLNKLKTHPNTLSVMDYSDRWDIEATFVVKTLKEFDTITSDILASFSDIILEKGRLAEIETFHSILFPYNFYTNQKLKKSPSKGSEYSPDKKDLDILKTIKGDCRLSTYDISKKVKLSPDAIGLRLKRLIKSNIIKKFSLLPNFSLLGFSMYTFAVKMKVLSSENESKFKAFVEDHPHIIKAVKTLGTWDLIIYIISDSPRDFHQTIKQIKKEFSQSIHNYETWVTLKEEIFNPIPEVIFNQ